MAKSDRETQRQLIREAAEADLETFINLVHPHRVLGNIHREIIQWWNREEAKSHQLLLMPRDHQKSALVAYRVAHEITKNPAVRILYISSTSNLATKQLKFIKDILLSDTYRYYWPEMVNPDESQREKWTEREISVDHPTRKAETVRDPTIFTAGLTTGIVGMHCDISVFDDVVVITNAEIAEGRSKVETQFSLLASIESAEARQWVVGTRYHPKDLYGVMANIEIESYDTEGNLVSVGPMYEVFERQVENRGDGTGEFIWPKQTRSDGKTFGFDEDILARKRAQYQNQRQFRAQYYNDPNAYEESLIKREYFQYFDKAYLKRDGGFWTYNGRRLNVFAAIDFAYSLRKEADYTAIAVVGCDSSNNFYILDLVRLRTNKISEYFKEILRLHEAYGFRRLRAEVTAAQDVIVKELKDNYIKQYGLALSVEDYRPNSRSGVKEERIANILQPKYENGQIWHYQSGNCQLLEEELLSVKPPHDDLKDAVAACIDACVPPSVIHSTRDQTVQNLGRISHSRFGGLGVIR